MSDQFGMPEIDYAPVANVIRDLRKKLASRDAEIATLKGMVNEIQAARFVQKEHNDLLVKNHKLSEQVTLLRDATMEAINLRIAPFRDGIQTDDDLIKADPVTRRFKQAFAATEPTK